MLERGENDRVFEFEGSGFDVFGDGEVVGRYPDGMVTNVFREVCDFVEGIGLNSFNFGPVNIGYVGSPGNSRVS